MKFDGANESTPLKEQLDYYCARAAEYDQWWLRMGRYDRGEELNSKWFADCEKLVKALEKFRPSGRILELACGTGIWTERLLQFSTDLTALDGSGEMLSLNEARVKSSKVHYIQTDLFEWKPNGRFDTVFFGFWLSHVPPEKFEAFWELVRSCLAPRGRVFFVDSRWDLTSTASDHELTAKEGIIQRRRLNNGREYQVYKIFYKPRELAERLKKLGWSFDIQETPQYFIHGAGRIG